MSGDPMLWELRGERVNACFVLQFDHVYFTDIILLTVRLLVVPAPSTTGDAEFTVVAMETLSNIIWRVGHINASGTTFPTQLSSCNFTAQPSMQSDGKTLIKHTYSFEYQLKHAHSGVVPTQYALCCNKIPTYL